MFPHVRNPAPFWLVLLILLGGSPSIVNAANNQAEHSIVLRVGSPDVKLDPQEIRISSKGRVGKITSVLDGPKAGLSIAIVVDTGPRQVKALAREKELASSFINRLSTYATQFMVIGAGDHPSIVATSSDASEATSAMESLVAEKEKHSRARIYDSVALALLQLSARPGVRVLVVVAEGNDFWQHRPRQRNGQNGAGTARLLHRGNCHGS